MVRLARCEVFDPDEVVIGHLLNRTCRRCFLFGDDKVSGRNVDHRKIRIEEYLLAIRRLFRDRPARSLDFIEPFSSQLKVAARRGRDLGR